MTRAFPKYSSEWARCDPQPERWRPMPSRAARETWSSCIKRVAALYQCPSQPTLLLYQSLRRDHGMMDETAARHAMWAHGLVDSEE